MHLSKYHIPTVTQDTHQKFESTIQVSHIAILNRFFILPEIIIEQPFISIEPNLSALE